MRAAQVKHSIKVATLVALLLSVSPTFAAEDDSEALGQFQALLEGIDQKSFDMLSKYFDETDMTNRVLSHRDLSREVSEGFKDSFWEIIEAAFMRGFPAQGSELNGELISFAFKDGLGKACIRYALPNYDYRYLLFDLRHDGRGRLKVTDMLDSNNGQLFSRVMNDDLLGVKPTPDGTRRLLTIKSPKDQQIFQVTEILKATRDAQPVRYFEIYDALDEQLKREPLIARRSLRMAFLVADRTRIQEAIDIFDEVFPDDTNSKLAISSFYIGVQDYVNSFKTLRRFQQSFSVKDGALPAKLSALALANGDAEDAEKYALEATVNEPKLELGWWSLLRVRAGVENYDGAVEVLTELEDAFGHQLDEAKLRRDQYRAFAKLAASPQFKEWRATRQ